MIRIGSVLAKEMGKVRGKLKVRELASGSKISIPVIIINGNSKGPVLWLNGGVHGDELNGIFAIRQLVTELKLEQVNGILICTLVCNPLAFQGRSKVSPLDNLDLDQQFPGNIDGLILQRIGYIL